MKEFEMMNLANPYYNGTTARVESGESPDVVYHWPQELHLVEMKLFLTDNYQKVGPRQLLKTLMRVESFPKYWDNLTLVFDAVVFEDTTVMTRADKERHGPALFVPVMEKNGGKWHLGRHWFQNKDMPTNYDTYFRACLPK